MLLLAIELDWNMWRSFSWQFVTMLLACAIFSFRIEGRQWLRALTLTFFAVHQFAALYMVYAAVSGGLFTTFLLHNAFFFTLIGAVPFLVIRPNLLAGPFRPIRELLHKYGPAVLAYVGQSFTWANSHLDAWTTRWRARRPSSAVAVDERAIVREALKRGGYRPGFVSANVTGPDGRLYTVWVPPPGQTVSAQIHAWFGTARLIGMGLVGLYLLSQMPSWLRPIAVLGTAAALTAHHLGFFHTIASFVGF